MKSSIAIAGENALPSAFVIFRGSEKYIPFAAEYGYDGAELAMKNASEINISKLDSLLKASGLSVSCISTGQVFAETGYMFTDSDKNRGSTLRNIGKDFIDLALELCEYDKPKDVTLILEPVNRYDDNLRLSNYSEWVSVEILR